MVQKQTVLIIDNNPEELMPLVCFIEDKFEPLLVPEQADYLCFAKDHCPSLVLVDDMLSDPNCYDTCQCLRQVPAMADVPIILMSDLSVQELSTEIDYLGADDYIQKPIDKQELIEKIDTLLSFRGAH